MSTSDNFVWIPGSPPPSLQSHSAAKLKLIERYLAGYFEAVVPNPRSDRLRISLVDGFCGGGAFKSADGTIVPGSPVIMIEAVKAAEKRLKKSRRKKLTIDARYYFVDKSRPTIDYLKHELNQIRSGAQFDNSIRCLEGKFEDRYESITSDILARARTGRSIFLLDQCGYKDITTSEVTHTTILDTAGIADYRSVIGYFAQILVKDLRLVSGYDVLYGKVKAFVQEQLFDRTVELENPNTLRNLSELAATKTLIETFKKAINALTVRDRGDAEIRDTIKLRQTRPFVVKDQGYRIPKKSVFNRVIGDSQLELQFANFLEDCPDVVSYAKNYFAVHFKLDYVNVDGNISNYYPDFLVKLTDARTVIVETKGLEVMDVPLKMQRLHQWCEDVNRVQSDVKYDFVFVDQEGFEKYKPKSFRQLADSFKEYKKDA